MIRQRTPGETIGAGDVLLIGEKAFAVADTLLVGQIVLRGELNAVYTSEPRTTLQEPFPARPERPACEECGEPSEYSIDSDDRCPTDRGVEVRSMKVHLCRECYEQFRERAQ